MDDKASFWVNEGHTYYDKFQKHTFFQNIRYKDQERHLIQLVKVYNFRSILEIGCGFGRYTKILYDLFQPDSYVALDVSDAQLERAKKYVGHAKVDFNCTRVQDFEINKKFDLVFASEILMHIEFEYIEAVIKKMIEFSSNKIITIDWFNKNLIGQTKWQGVGFMHDYETQYLKHGARQVRVHLLPLPKLWLFKNISDRISGTPRQELQAIIEVDAG